MVAVGALGRGIEDSCDIKVPHCAYIATTSSVPAVFHCGPNDLFELSTKNKHAHLVAMWFLNLSALLRLKHYLGESNNIYSLQRVYAYGNECHK